MSDRISVDEILYPGSDRWSPNGRFQLIFQEDCNLVLYVDGGNAIWASNTYNEYGSQNCQVLMQVDGNLVMYDGNGQAIWESGTSNYDGCSSPYILVQDDGNVCLYDDNVQGCYWNSGTYGY